MSDKLTEFRYSEGTEWRFKLLQDMQVSFPTKKLGKHRFFDPKGNHWMSFDSSIVTIYKDYAWDGSSPKFRLFGKWQGTPDYEQTRLASMIHDALRQWLHCQCYPITGKDCDFMFGEVMRSEQFPLWQTYQAAVRIFGSTYSLLGRLNGKKPEGYCDI